MSITSTTSTGRIRVSKGAVNCRERRKATVTGYRAGTQPLVEVRMFRDDRDPGAFVDLSVPQARELVRLLETAIAAHDSNGN